MTSNLNMTETTTVADIIVSLLCWQPKMRCCDIFCRVCSFSFPPLFILISHNVSITAKLALGISK
jgi:hypothetical protein